jgi:hypothetical protein
MIKVSQHYGVDPDVVEYKWSLDDYLDRLEVLFIDQDKKSD